MLEEKAIVVDVMFTF